eukprot:evm.model.scf_392.2 EVM.evm.TU.scf_392.2   scf_392:6820-7491(+)
MTHVLSEVRKAGHTQHCKYYHDLSMMQPSISRVFNASNLHDSKDLMPNFLVQLVQFLLVLPEHLFLVSIYESGGNDTTGKWLGLLEDVLNELRVPNRIVINGDEVRQEGQERLDFLSRVRNRALEPMWSSPTGSWDKVVFTNDVFFCAQDIIRLLQHDRHRVRNGLHQWGPGRRAKAHPAVLDGQRPHQEILVLRGICKAHHWEAMGGQAVVEVPWQEKGSDS